MTNTRPVFVTVICVIGFIGALLGIPLIFTGAARSIGLWYQIYASVAILAGLACFAGLWMMKKWGVIAYTSVFCINQVVLIIMNIWNIYSIVLPAVVIVAGFIYFREMK